MLTRLLHVAMAVPDLAPCTDFYGRALGLSQSGEGVDSHGQAFRKYRIGPTDLILSEDPDAVPYADLAGNVRTEVDHFALYVDDVVDIYETLRSRGILFRDRPHATELGHRNMQRSLVSFEDPFGFTLQLSQTVDPRPRLAARIEAKKAMAGMAGIGGRTGGRTATINRFGGIDHISIYCTDFAANRALYRDILGLDEFFYSTTREEGAAVGTGFEQGAFAVGGTDIELASDDEWRHLAYGPIRELGLLSDQIDRARASLRAQGVPFEEPARDGALYYPGRSSLAFNSPDGMQLHIVG